MVDNIPGTPTGKISGSMYLYRNPELLTLEKHGNMGFRPPAQPFEFVRHVRAVPLTMFEFSSAQRHYPIVFSSLEEPVPLAVMGVLEDRNLFVDDAGNWDKMSYVPNYLRCYPFAIASEPGGRMAVVVDVDAPSVSEEPEYPFFVGDKPSEHTDTLTQFCAQYDAERKRTREFCERLVELDLLAALRATHTPEGAEEPERLADYISVNVEKLNALSADVLKDLHDSGFLAAIYLQIYSLENWRRLVGRRLSLVETES